MVIDTDLFVDISLDDIEADPDPPAVVRRRTNVHVLRRSSKPPLLPWVVLCRPRSR